MFTKRHYEAIAKIIHDTETDVDNNLFLDRLCTYFKGDNEKFNKDRFLRVCRGKRR